jgi:hypothetical protein
MVVQGLVSLSAHRESPAARAEPLILKVLLQSLSVIRYGSVGSLKRSLRSGTQAASTAFQISGAAVPDMPQPAESELSFTNPMDQLDSPDGARGVLELLVLRSAVGRLSVHSSCRFLRRNPNVNFTLVGEATSAVVHSVDPNEGCSAAGLRPTWSRWSRADDMGLLELD